MTLMMTNDPRIVPVMQAANEALNAVLVMHGGKSTDGIVHVKDANFSNVDIIQAVLVAALEAMQRSADSGIGTVRPQDWADAVGRVWLMRPGDGPGIGGAHG